MLLVSTLECFQVCPRASLPCSLVTPQSRGHSTSSSSGRTKPARNCDQCIGAGQTRPTELAKRQQLANSVFLNAGVTFSVYSDNKGTERIFPFDLLPRVILPEQWAPLERGLSQRVRALNLFLKDIYSEQKVLKDKIIPSELVLGSTGYLKKMMGIHPPHDNYIHISGIDLIRAQVANSWSSKTTRALLLECRTCWKTEACSNARCQWCFPICPF